MESKNQSIRKRPDGVSRREISNGKSQRNDATNKIPKNKFIQLIQQTGINTTNRLQIDSMIENLTWIKAPDHN
jgi:hypothetical protein